MEHSLRDTTFLKTSILVERPTDKLWAIWFHKCSHLIFGTL